MAHEQLPKFGEMSYREQANHLDSDEQDAAFRDLESLKTTKRYDKANKVSQNQCI